MCLQGGTLHGTEEAAHSTPNSEGGPHPRDHGQRGRDTREMEGVLSGSFHTKTKSGPRLGGARGGWGCSCSVGGSRRRPLLGTPDCTCCLGTCLYRCLFQRDRKNFP